MVKREYHCNFCHCELKPEPKKHFPVGFRIKDPTGNFELASLTDEQATDHVLCDMCIDQIITNFPRVLRARAEAQAREW
jgi:hypothetical protein